MKDLKFRAWDELNKIMHNDFQFIKSGNEGNDWILFVSDKQPLSSFNWKENPYFQQQCKIMQFTGLKDKNGKEIYEGDIIKGSFNDQDNENYDFIDVVSFDNGKFQCENNADFDLWIYELKILGNIYENKNLLK